MASEQFERMRELRRIAVDTQQPMGVRQQAYAKYQSEVEQVANVWLEKFRTDREAAKANETT